MPKNGLFFLIHVVDKSTLLFDFQYLFCVPFWSLAQKKTKKIIVGTTNCFENLVSDFWKKNLIVPEMYFEKKSFVFKLILISFKKNSSTFKAQLRFFPQIWDHILNTFLSWPFFYVFCARLHIGTQKSYWKSNSTVLLPTSWILQILSIFWHFAALRSSF